MTTAFQMRASADFLHALDEWRRAQPDLPGRAEAIRRLVQDGVDRAGIKTKPVRTTKKKGADDETR